MNRFARIMQSIGWGALLFWIATWVYGYRVAGDPTTLAWHTIGALTAAALTLLSRVWTLCYLALAGSSSGPDCAPGSTASKGLRDRRLAFMVSSLALVMMGVAFLLSGRLLWHRASPATHALFGAATLVGHFVALLFERRALHDERPAAAEIEHRKAARQGEQLL